MKINSFTQQLRHSHRTTSESIRRQYKKQKEVDALLGVIISEGRTLIDHLMSEDLKDQISATLYTGFMGMIGHNINSYDALRNSLLARIENGESSGLGLINKIKGQLAEKAFLTALKDSGIQTTLANADNQEGWDIAIEKDGNMRFVQVTLDHDDETIINEITRVNDKLVARVLSYNNTAIERIDFAVPEYVYDLVVQAVYDEGMEVEVLRFGRTEGKFFGLAGLFADLFDAGLTGGELQNLANAFLAYKGAKEIDAFLSDTALQLSITTIHAGSGSIAERLIQKISMAGGIPASLLATAVLRTARTVATRTINRYHQVNWQSGNSKRPAVRVAS